MFFANKESYVVAKCSCIIAYKRIVLRNLLVLSAHALPQLPSCSSPIYVNEYALSLKRTANDFCHKDTNYAFMLMFFQYWVCGELPDYKSIHNLINLNYSWNTEGVLTVLEQSDQVILHSHNYCLNISNNFASY